MMRLFISTLWFFILMAPSFLSFVFCLNQFVAKMGYISLLQQWWEAYHSVVQNHLRYQTGLFVIRRRKGKCFDKHWHAGTFTLKNNFKNPARSIFFPSRWNMSCSGLSHANFIASLGWFCLKEVGHWIFNSLSRF